MNILDCRLKVLSPRRICNALQKKAAYFYYTKNISLSLIRINFENLQNREGMKIKYMIFRWKGAEI